jgi:hypothetical protein
MGWKIFGLFVSIFLIAGGASGHLVLRGTNSSQALMVVGVIFLIWDIYSIATHKRQKEKFEIAQKDAMEKNEKFAAAIMEESDSLDKEYQYKLVPYPEKSFVHGKYQVYLNGEHIGQISEKEKNVMIKTRKVKNVLCVVDDNDKIGSKGYSFFKVIGEPAKGYFIMDIKNIKNLYFIRPGKNGLEILRPQ